MCKISVINRVCMVVALYISRTDVCNIYGVKEDVLWHSVFLRAFLLLLFAFFLIKYQT